MSAPASGCARNPCSTAQPRSCRSSVHPRLSPSSEAPAVSGCTTLAVGPANAAGACLPAAKARMIMHRRFATLFGLLAGLTAGSALAQPRTLQDALAAAYSNNPTCRPRGRSCAPSTKACRRPWPAGARRSPWPGAAAMATAPSAAPAAPAPRLHPQQPRHLHRAGHRDPAALSAAAPPAPAPTSADNRVFAQRGRLLATEQQVFTDTINAYVERHPGAAGPAAQHQQRAGADPAAAGHQRPLPGRRDHPHRRGPGRGGAGRRPRHAADLGRQPADRARHLPPPGRRPAGPAGRAAADQAADPQPGRGGAAGVGQQPQRRSPRCSTTPPRATTSTCNSAR